MKASQVHKKDQRKTRSFQVSVEDEKFLDLNFIDLQNRKNKQNKINSRIINEPIGPTTIKFLLDNEALNTNKDLSDATDRFLDENNNNKAENQKMSHDQHPPLPNINYENEKIAKAVKIGKSSKKREKKSRKGKIKKELPIDLNKNQQCEKNEDLTIEIQKNDPVPMLEKNKDNIIVSNNINIEKQENTEKKEEAKTVKTIKKVNKRYQELLENSLLIFDKPIKENFSIIKAPNVPKIKQNDEISEYAFFESLTDAELKLNLEERNPNKYFKKTPAFSTKKSPSKSIPQIISSSKILNSNVNFNNGKNKQKDNKKNSKPKSKFELNKDSDLKSGLILSNSQPVYIPLIITNSSVDKDLIKIYSVIRDIRLLGKKRNFHSFLKPLILEKSEELKPIDSSSIVKFEEISNIFNINSKENINAVIKRNFLNENIIQKLNKSLSVLNNSRSTAFNNTSYSMVSGDTISNPFDESFRRGFANTLDFIQNFKEDYAPIKMQKENEKLFERMRDQPEAISISSKSNNKTNSSSQVSKTHFIKKKQSAINIKRQCGVSYVVPSESKQFNVSDRYKALGHLVYQGTYSVNQIHEDNLISYMENLIMKELMNRPLIVTIFESHDEEDMKEYLLYPEKRVSIAKEVFIIESLDEIWKFSKDRFFLAIHLLFDEQLGIKNFSIEEINNLAKKDFLVMSDIQIGILFRKATSGIKSVLKLYKNGGLCKIQHPSTYKLANLNIDENIDFTIEKLSGSNMSTLAMRIELYVQEMQWKNSNIFSKEFLFTFMSLVEDKISKLILNWNEYRYLMHSLSKDDKLREYINNFPFFTFSEKENQSQESYNYTRKKEYFNLDKEIFENKIIEEVPKYSKFDLINSYLIRDGVIKINNSFSEKLSLVSNLNFSNLPLSMYIISTRDCFVFDLNIEVNEIELNGRKVIKKEYFFDANSIPSNFYKFQASKDDLRVGLVTYENFYSNEELNEIERKIEQTEEYSVKDAYLPETAQKTFSGEKIKRTKFFFGSRYMWTKKQLAEPNSYVAAGIRKDVSPAPYWMKEKIEYPLVKAGIVSKDFINSFALNVYHDGSEGLCQHFDDAVRFKQPIFTIRLFSDCRLSFGSQLYGFCNGAFTIPLPRGCICVMEENSYAPNGVKHCIRPCDMTGKSSALIMRQMHPIMVNEAEKYDLMIDFPSWFSSLSINDKSVSYGLQKLGEAEFLIKLSEMENKNLNYKNADVSEEVVEVINDLMNCLDFYNQNLAVKSQILSTTEHKIRERKINY